MQTYIVLRISSAFDCFLPVIADEDIIVCLAWMPPPWFKTSLMSEQKWQVSYQIVEKENDILFIITVLLLPVMGNVPFPYICFDAFSEEMSFRATIRSRQLFLFWRTSRQQCLWHKPTELANPFLFRSCVDFRLYGPFNCISLYKFSRQLYAFSLYSSGLISALLVLSTIYLFMKISLTPDIILYGWLSFKHQLTN